MVENFIDWAHVPFVHRTTIGKGQSPRSPRVDVRYTDQGAYAEVVMGITLAFTLIMPYHVRLDFYFPKGRRMAQISHGDSGE